MLGYKGKLDLYILVFRFKHTRIPDIKPGVIKFRALDCVITFLELHVIYFRFFSGLYSNLFLYFYTRVYL